LALLAIVALIAGLAWLMKRMRGFGNAGHDRIQVLSERALGPKERCVLLRVGGKDILVGGRTGSVNTLHVFPEGAIALTSGLTRTVGLRRDVPRRHASRHAQVQGSADAEPR
jgi:flagellar protein FliO/FliZ